MREIYFNRLRLILVLIKIWNAWIVDWRPAMVLDSNAGAMIAVDNNMACYYCYVANMATDVLALA